MKSFGYCLWLVPGIRNKVINFTDGFKPHITIKKNLTRFQSFEEFKKIYLEEPIKFKLDDKYILSKEDNFYALYYKISPLVYKPLWWPKDAHISFRYKYDEPFIEGEVYISLPRAKENAQKYDEPFSREVSRLIIHGCLHLIGLKDQTDTEKENMTNNEDAILKVINWAGLFKDQ